MSIPDITSSSARRVVHCWRQVGLTHWLDPQDVEHVMDLHQCQQLQADRRCIDHPVDLEGALELRSQLL